MADKDFEISNYQEKIQWLENKLLELQNQLENKEIRYKEDLERLSKEKKTVVVIPQTNGTVESKKETSDEQNKCSNVSFRNSRFFNVITFASTSSSAFTRKNWKGGKRNVKC